MDQDKNFCTSFPCTGMYGLESMGTEFSEQGGLLPSGFLHRNKGQRDTAAGAAAAIQLLS